MNPFLSVPAWALVLGASGPALQQNPSPASSNLPGSSEATMTSAAPSLSQGDASTVYLRVYRQPGHTGAALAPSIYADDKQVVRVGNGRRVSIRLTPGARKRARSLWK